MDKPYILALDQGTTSSKALLYNVENRSVMDMVSSPLKQNYPRPGWVEHDANEIWAGQLDAAHKVLSRTHINPQSIACIGITNQRETVVIWDKKTGEPIHPAVVWQCRRTAEMCERLKAKGLEETVRAKTGLVVDAYFSGTKIRWLLDNVTTARDRANRGELLAGTMDTWLVWKLTDGQVHATDYSNASRTMLFNINTLDWDDELLEMMDIPRCLLPKVVPSSGVIGYTSPHYFGVSIPISGMAGDQQSALFGQTCYEIGSAKNTYGTGCFILMNVGRHPIPSRHRLLTTIAWGIDGEVEYALEGSVFNAGSAIQWLRDEMGLIDSADQSGPEAEKVADTGGVYVVPAFTGLGAPYWDMYARGTICGITRGTNRRHIIRATLESIAYQSLDVLDAMQLDSGVRVSELKVDGGASACDFLMQFQADMTATTVLRPKISETTALGAIYLAGLGVNIWKNRQGLLDQWEQDAVFIPSKDPFWIHQRYIGWKKAVNRAGSDQTGG